MSEYKVLGVRVNGVQIPDVVATVRQWIGDRGPARFIAVTGMHGVMEAQQSGEFRQVLAAADLVVPDGMPLVWMGRTFGLPLRRRVYGPELMETFLRETGSEYRHFFYGGAEGVADQLAVVLHKKFDIQVAGTWCPPFRTLTSAEEDEVAALIEESKPDVVWIGLSTPKQERWMQAHRHLNTPVMIGVGAAFDFHTGRAVQAPVWMRENGFEWLFRLLSEPRRLWRRYIILGGKFGWNVTLQLLGWRDFS
jgi:N-acetylglucosaminyldiphosphoundecaprenol N-acetyl-beta-D-mannosaminyltransferase